jgi:hypothetical protein
MNALFILVVICVVTSTCMAFGKCIDLFIYEEGYNGPLTRQSI